MTFKFIPCPITYWKGRYSRSLATDGVFHAKKNNFGEESIYVYSRIGEHEIQYSVHAPYEEIKALYGAVGRAKKFLKGNEGGSFVINEFKQVIVPSNDTDSFYRRAICGTIEGIIKLRNPNTGEIVDISDDSGLRIGDRWNKPYVGIPYSLSRYGNIYFRHIQFGMGNEVRIHPLKKDNRLITMIRQVKKQDGARFIVNPWGIVLTKKEFQDGWISVYVGRINYDKWFPKEDGSVEPGIEVLL